MPPMIRDFVQSADLRPQALGVGVPDDLEEGDGHREDHEHVDHLHVGSCRQAVGDSNVAAICIAISQYWKCDSANL